MKKLLFSFAIFFTFFVVYAQDDSTPEISADRPGVSTGPTVINAGTWQIETGAALEHNANNNDFTENNTFGTAMLRVGLNNCSEFRLQGDFAQFNSGGSNISGMLPVVLGTKIAIAESKGWLPQTSFMYNLTLPYVGKENFRPANFGSAVYLLMENELNDNIGLGYNVGLEYNGDAAEPNTFAALCLEFGITKNLGAYVESYNYFCNAAKPSFLADFGFAYLINN